MWGGTSSGHLDSSPRENQLHLWQSKDTFAQPGSEDLWCQTTASMGNLLFSLEKTASTPSLKFCDLHPLLPVLAMHREDMSMGREVAPINHPIWTWPLTSQSMQAFLLRSHEPWPKDHVVHAPVEALAVPSRAKVGRSPISSGHAPVDQLNVAFAFLFQTAPRQS